MAKGRKQDVTPNAVFTGVVKRNKTTGEAKLAVKYNDADGVRHEKLVAISVVDGELVFGTPVDAPAEAEAEYAEEVAVEA